VGRVDRRPRRRGEVDAVVRADLLQDRMPPLGVEPRRDAGEGHRRSPASLGRRLAARVEVAALLLALVAVDAEGLAAARGQVLDCLELRIADEFAARALLLGDEAQDAVRMQAGKLEPVLEGVAEKAQHRWLDP